MTGFRMYPNGARFGFSFVDDTDYASVENVSPVYEELFRHGILGTKTVWVYPSRDHYGGQSLTDPEYAAFVRKLVARGYEIGLHNVGSGHFTRQEILRGIELFETVVGYKPRMQINHASNPDNIYGGPLRFVSPIRQIYQSLKRIQKRVPEARGHDPSYVGFWGDFIAEHVDYIRAMTFLNLNTAEDDPRAPYRIKGKTFANYWFSSADCHTVQEFCALLQPERVRGLEEAGGYSILYTHFANDFCTSDGKVRPEVVEVLSYLASRRGWFVPASTLLDHIRRTNGPDSQPGYAYQLRLHLRWLRSRILKRAKFGR